MTKRIYLLVAFAVSATIFSTNAAEKIAKIDKSKLPPVSPKKEVTFASDIRPLFEQSCVKCHGAEKPKGKLRLDSREAVLNGSEHGPVLKIGKSDDSLLVHNISHVGDPDNYMPPPNNKAKIGPLSAEQVGLVRAWIEQGAK